MGDSTPLSEHSHNEGCPRPFGDYALALCQRGLAVVPCGGDDGKTPLIKGWHKSKRSAATITKLALRYPDANIGIVCGLSGVGIVDVDDPTQVSAMLARFGDTPLITRTPSGGCHLWYAAPDVVRSTNLRSEDLAVDIKADGGLVIVPPSFNRQTGKPYVFEPGSWDDLGRLPLFRVEALGQSKTSPKSSRSAKPATAGGAIGQGMRDDAVFHRAMLEAPHVKSVDELIAAMQSFNETHCWPPLPARQVEEKARSAWGYEVRGDNWIGHGQGGVVVSAKLADDLLKRPHGEDALALLVKLKRCHGARSEFSIVAKDMARDQVMVCWGPRRYARARNILLTLGVLKPVSPAECDARGRWTPATYTFSRPGAVPAPNVILHAHSGLPP